jgi:hypothetical protein
VYKLTVEGIKGYQSTVSPKFNIDYNEEYLLKNYKESDSKNLNHCDMQIQACIIKALWSIWSITYGSKILLSLMEKLSIF